MLASCSLGVGTVRPSRYQSSMLVSKRVTTADSFTGLARWVARSRRHEDAVRKQFPMPTTTTEQAPAVDQPKHPLHALTTFELRDFRRQLENAIAFFDRQDPVPAVRGDLQATLDSRHRRTGIPHQARPCLSPAATSTRDRARPTHGASGT